MNTYVWHIELLASTVRVLSKALRSAICGFECQSSFESVCVLDFREAYGENASAEWRHTASNVLRVFKIKNLLHCSFYYDTL